MRTYLSPFVLVVVGDWLVIGSARLFSLSALLLSIVTNGVSPHRVVGCTIGAKKKGVKFFFKFFFRGVWVLRCGCSGVGARVWVLGSVGGGGGIGMGAGWMGAGWGWGGLDSSPGLDARV